MNPSQISAAPEGLRQDVRPPIAMEPAPSSGAAEGLLDVPDLRRVVSGPRDPHARVACETLFKTGMVLVAGHGRDAVVQNDQGQIVVVEHGIDQAGNAGVEKSRIADK